LIAAVLAARAGAKNDPVVRVTFARATHRFSGATKLCDPRS
jgi:hypothetical protein